MGNPSTPEGGRKRAGRGKTAKLAAIAGGVAVLDQATKAAVLAWLPLHRSMAVIPGFFDLTHIRNPGGAFGLLAGQSAGIRNAVFLFFSSLAVGLILYFYRSTPPSHRLLSTGFALVLGGAVGNLVDRLRFGHVVDFLDVYIGRYHWPAFNVADSAITLGILIFLGHMALGRLPE
jgi:signal peptidase II